MDFFCFLIDFRRSFSFLEKLFCFLGGIFLINLSSSVRRYFFNSSLFSIGNSFSDSSPEDSELGRSVKKDFLFSPSFFHLLLV